MKKIITSAILFLLTAGLLIGCSPASSFIEDTTEKPSGIVAPPDSNDGPEFNDFALHSDSFFFSKGEYFYFFSYFLAEYLASHTEAELAASNLDIKSGKSLHEQYYVDNDEKKISWYDVFRDVSVRYMEKILLVCEVAQAEESRHIYEAEQYRNDMTAYIKSLAKAEGMSIDQYVAKQYNGNVGLAELQSIWQKEYIYNAYTDAKLKAINAAITAEEAEIYFESLVEQAGDDLSALPEKNTDPSRNIICITFGADKASADSMLAEFLAGEHTAEALQILADAGDCTVEKIKSCTEAGVDNVIGGWLFADERELNDAGILTLTNLGYCLFFWESEGEAQYIVTARKGLADKQLNDWMAEIKEVLSIVIDENVLNSLNA
jgi:hypothetical protein